MDLSPKIRYTDTSYIIAQQWEKGREKTTFPTVYSFDYNQRKFENLAKVDRKNSLLNASRPLIQKDDGTASTSSAERKRRRKTRSLERRRQKNELELSDSDEDILPAPVPIPNGISKTIDEVDEGSVKPLEVQETIVITTNTELDIPLVIDDLIFGDKNEPIYNEVLKIDETESDSQNVVVDVHATDSPATCEVLEIVEGDRDRHAVSPNRELLIRTKLTKERELEDVLENEKENESNASDGDKGEGVKDVENPSADDKTDNRTEVVCSETLSPCDKNESVTNFNSDITTSTKASSECIIEQDVNHNDIIVVKTTSTSETPVNNLENDKNKNYCVKNQNEILELSENEVGKASSGYRRISDSSVSSFNESDGLDTEPTYAKVDKKNKLKNYEGKQLIPKSQTFPVQSSHHEKTSDHLGLNYVTERILASVLPRRNAPKTSTKAISTINEPEEQIEDRPHNDVPDELPQDIYEQELISMLEQKHGKNYKLFDLESCISTITLEKLCELCKHIDSWLGSGREKVVVLQDRGDRQRLGAAVAAYLEYLGICASNYPHRNGFSNEDASVQNTIARNWLDLDIFSMKKFLEDVIGPLRVPSQRRYLQYFSGLLSGKITVNSSPLYLKYVTIESPPSWYEAEWRSFIKIYEGLNCVFTSDIYVIPITTRQFIYEIGQLRLRGEVIIRCYQLIRPTTNERAYQNSLQQDKRELIFSVQFHTCAITNREVAFYRNDLDFACDDPRFPNDHKVTLHFGDNQTNDNRALYIQSPLVRLEPLTAVAKYNSLENFEDDNSSHTQGPLDGSLYATILKSPKSPLKSPTFPFNLVTNNNTYYNTRNTTSSNSSSSNNNAIDIIVTPSKPQRTGSQQTLISPPPEFSNKKIIEIKECYTTLEPAVNNSNTQTLNRDLIKSNQTSRSYTSTPSYEEIRIPSRSTSRDIILRHQQQQQQTYGHQTTPRPSSSLSSSTYQQHLDLPRRSSSISRSASYTPNNQYSETASQQSRSTENYQYSGSSVQNGTSTIRSTSYQDGRESVKSPLTLSMDSGISSSGINRRIQGSSVSPSSFPSQGSPQDRHQELDDILSDMLLTVQDIPDISKTTRQQYIRKSIQNINLAQSQPTTHHRHHQHHHHHHQYNTVKRSQSYTSQDDTSSNISRNTTGHIRDHCGDFYDTASTTTTLTPTPSESGRDTPLQQQQQHHIYTSTTNIARNNKREQQTLTQSAIEQRERELIMDLQNQSFDYPQPLRTQHSTSSSIDKNNNKKVIYNSATSEDEENIPYHAREDSRPFTYGDPTGVQLSPTNTSGTGMIKLQSGLSSPSLVRKHLGGSTGGLASDSATATRKRNDFEEMLMKRREQILNDKYSRGDRTPNGNSSVNNPNKWNTTTTTTTFNGYPYHEPLKRSNTLDGGFGRGSGYTSDGPSSKTWLQLQQQKLRAKKVQENQDYYATSTYSDTRSRRSRPNAAYRYDGYASDTAAFDVDAFIDEVDYRRPLHVQTPNRSDNNYQTVTTTTTVTQNNNERPFVTVKRAHEQSRGNGIGVREESFSSYRSETEPEISLAGSPRPETPAFPITPRTPYGLNGNVSPALPPKSPTTARKDLYGNQTTIHHIVNQNDNASCYTSRRNSTTSTVNSEPQEIAPHLVKFVRDSSKYWYKPSISREEAVALLRNASPGTFIVRDSTTFAKAYGLVVKVAYPPPGVQSRGTGGDELVRHFLVEPTTRGVRLKGCANEPVFTSLSALVYQHSITPLALPCKLIIPERDIQNIEYHSPAQQQLLQQGAACNVLYLFTCETESLTGPEAVRKAISLLYSRKPLPKPYEVHFKVSHQGITLTDNTRQLFFRKHYPSGNISYCGLDPNDRRWSVRTEGDVPVSNKSIFAFVARRSTSSTDNQCHVFCEMEPNQPATAIVLFANRVIPSYGAQPVSRNI